MKITFFRANPASQVLKMTHTNFDYNLGSEHLIQKDIRTMGNMMNPLR